MNNTGGPVSPWEAMTDGDADRFGRDILNPADRKRWCAAIMFGGLPYLWNHDTEAVRTKALGKLNMKRGDKVMLLGEEVPGIGFHHEIREAIGDDGELVIVDVREQVLGMFFDGQMPKWEYDFTKPYADNYFDSIFVGQGVAHAADWGREGTELIRAIKPSGALVMAEISFSSKFYERVNADVHIAYWIRKLMEGMGQNAEDLPNHDLDDVERAFEGKLDGLTAEEWRGCDLLWGTKPL